MSMSMSMSMSGVEGAVPHLPFACWRSPITNHRSRFTFRLRPAGNDHARWPEQAIFESITAPSLTSDNPFGVVAGFVRDRLMQIRIEFLADGFDGLQAVFRQKIVKLLGHQTHSGMNR